MNTSFEVRALAGLLEYIASKLPEHLDEQRAAELAEALYTVADELRQAA